MISPRLRFALALSLLASMTACSGDEAPRSGDAPPPAPTIPAPPPPPKPALDPNAPPVVQFMTMNGVDGIIDAWLAEMHRQWDEQVVHMKVKPTPGFWEQSIAEFDFAAQRKLLADAVTSGISEAEMIADVEWMRASGMDALGMRLDSLSARVRPVQQRLAAIAQAAAARASGAPGADVVPKPAAAPPRRLSGADLEAIHLLMEELGWGRPGALDQALLGALRQAMSEAPAATWSDAQVIEAGRVAGLEIEDAFAQEWSPAEARALVTALRSPEGRRHDALMERLTQQVMARSEPFSKAVRVHVLKRYQKIFDAAWEERQRLRGEPVGAPPVRRGPPGSGGAPGSVPPGN